MSFQPRVFTFYSYKGGVGRSMAVLNTAYYLHARGRHVLVVDLDLEAPGASGFLGRTHELKPEKPQGDVVDVLAAVVNAVRSSPTDAAVPPLRLESFLQSVDPQKYALAKHPKASRARLDVLAADETRNYTARLSTLDLPNLSAKEVFQASDLLRAVLLQHRFTHFQPWQEAGQEPELTGYDYILVDSRTGLTEVGGLCVGPLSDRLVVLSGLNDQNISGTKHFLEFVGLKAKPRSAKEEAWDEADPLGSLEPGPPTLGPKPTLLVASPVPGGEMTYKKQRLAVLEDQMGLSPVKLSYHPQMALMETLFVRDHPDEYLAMEYATLADRVMAMVGDSSEQLRASVNRLIRPKREDKSKESSESDGGDLLKRMVRIALSSGHFESVFPIHFLSQSGLPDSLQNQIRLLDINLAPTDEYAAQAWLAWADALDTDEARKIGNEALFQDMEEKYRRSVLLKPDYHEALNNWGTALLNWAQKKQGAEADELFAQAGEKYDQALAIKPDKHEALNNWGTTLSDWAQKKQGAEADELFAQAGEKYHQALAIKPDDHEVLYNWGTTLSDWAKTKQGAEADELFAQVGEKYHQALAIKPDKHEALNNWGTTLSDWAKTKQGAEADELFAQAGEKFHQALAIKPDIYEALYNWGTTLSDWAKTKQGAEADELFAQAGEKYHQALTIKPEALNNWGVALLNWAQKKQGAEAEGLFGQASEKFHQALAIKPDDDSPIFNLACLCSLKGEVGKTLEWLESWRKIDPRANKKTLDHDSDFDRIRSDPLFRAFRDSLPD